MDWQEKHALIDFQESISRSKMILLVHVLFIGIFQFENLNYLYTNIHVLACIATVVLYSAARLFYDFKSRVVNILLILVYLTILLVEYLWVGLPGRPAFYQNGLEGRGLFVDIIFAMLPLLYIMLRLAMVFPLLIILRNHQQAKPYLNE